MVVDPKTLKDFTNLAIEIARKEAELAEAKELYEYLEGVILGTHLAGKSNPLTKENIAKPQLPWGPNDVRPSRGIAEAVEAVAELGGEASTKDVATRLGISGSAASIRLTRAMNAGFLRRTAFGTYGLSKPPEPPL